MDRDETPEGYLSHGAQERIALLEENSCYPRGI